MTLLAGCAKDLSKIPSLEQIQENGEIWALEQLDGYTAENLETVWGAAPWLENAQGGYIWRVPGDWDEVTVFFDEETTEVTYVAYSYIMEVEILEISDNYVVVKPVEGQWEATSADQIVVTLAKAQRYTDASYAVGDKVLVRHNGVIQETYPAQLEGLCQLLPLDAADDWNNKK